VKHVSLGHANCFIIFYRDGIFCSSNSLHLTPPHLTHLLEHLSHVTYRHRHLYTMDSHESNKNSFITLISPLSLGAEVSEQAWEAYSSIMALNIKALPSHSSSGDAALNLWTACSVFLGIHVYIASHTPISLTLSCICVVPCSI
jgi:hypothetical protein